ncbi:hypothetical protein RHSIM_Rhsim06G0082500 [Rhododendron simsii]|uniref:WW domain-containing protein n=1 Tax=Rhododendron simsii TaxID=118357 RepID=A0A834GQ62_RHOSS|nr:hypothetical protein RHSIM_Rhsim06G0082500 [Rhododendron simsii]
MVSLHTPLKTIKELENSAKKRKWEEEAVEELFEKPLLISSSSNSSRKGSKSPKSMFDTELLHLETPLPLEWQRCLDIQSGQIHYYNMRTQTRTSTDPRTTNSVPDPPTPPPTHMSLDLELNLPCGSTTTTKTSYSSPHGPTDDITTTGNSDTFLDWSKNKGNDYSGVGGGIPRCPSWLAFGGDEREMITAVCKKCHMLVMMCKSSPACPNCKFVHPPDQTLPDNLFANKSGLSLLC